MFFLFTFGRLVIDVLCPVPSSQRELLYMDWTETPRDKADELHIFPKSRESNSLTHKNLNRASEFQEKKKFLRGGRDWDVRKEVYSLGFILCQLSGLRLCLPLRSSFLPPPLTPGWPDPPPWTQKARDRHEYLRSPPLLASLKEVSSQQSCTQSQDSSCFSSDKCLGFWCFLKVKNIFIEHKLHQKMFCFFLVAQIYSTT